MQRPKRELIPRLQAGIPVINEIQPAIFQRTAVGFDLSKQERVKRAAVLGADLDNHLILVTSFSIAIRQTSWIGNKSGSRVVLDE